MSLGIPLAAPRSQGRLHHRKNPDKMTRRQLTDYRKALARSMALNDDRGFQHWGGIHGLPLPMYCQHHTDLFLPWHRAYLYFFELSLQDIDRTVSLPWWDWSSRVAHQRGVPEAYADPKVGGKDNPLASSEINDQARRQFASSGAKAPRRTKRNPGRPERLPSKEQVDAVLELSDFLDFSAQLEDIHDGIHVWVGGTMGEIPLAAYDPLFFAHHSMVDRLWRLWQLRHPGANPPAGLLDDALPPFQMTVAETLDVASLGYDYASSTQHSGGGT